MPIRFSDSIPGTRHHSENGIAWTLNIPSVSRDFIGRGTIHSALLRDPTLPCFSLREHIADNSDSTITSLVNIWASLSDENKSYEWAALPVLHFDTNHPELKYGEQPVDASTRFIAKSPLIQSFALDHTHLVHAPFFPILPVQRPAARPLRRRVPQLCLSVRFHRLPTSGGRKDIGRGDG